MAPKAKAKAAPAPAVIISAPKASEILAILATAKDGLTNEAILAANLERREASESTVRLSSPDITAYIGSPTRYNIWDSYIDDLSSNDEETKKTAIARLGGFRFKSLIGRGLVIAAKDATNAKGRLVYRFKLAD